MKKITLFLSILLAAATVSAQEKTAIRLLGDDYNALQLEITIGTLQEGKVSLCGETFSTLAIDGFQQPLANYGDPALPTLSRLIEVPLCEDFLVEVSDARYDTLPALEHRLLPVQLPRSKSDTTSLKLCINSQVYSTNAFLGQQQALVEAVGIARDRRLARLQFSPVRYNPVSGQVIVCRHATLTVRYQGADVEGSQELFNRYYSPAFNSGAQTLNSLYPKVVRTAAPVRFLIVANNMFRGHLDTFVQWKQRKGFRTDIVYTGDPGVGTDTTSIAAYIKGLYTNASLADPAPTYVLLVGDVAQLPTFDAHGSGISNDHVTDLYYMTWTSGDHIPDCHYGRFSAQTLAQLEPQVLKTLMYEQYTFPDPSFLDRAVMVAGVDAGNPGDNGYTYGDPAMDYAITNYVNGTHGWANVYYFKNNVSIIPSCTTNVTLSSSASGNAAIVRSYYNLGAGFINYTAHGGSTGWGTPNFGNSHVNQMTNNQKFGLMIGNCCLTNKFEEGTCFGEALLRKGDYAGAVGYIGGSNSTYWGQDFYWAVGVRSGIGPSMSMAYNSSNLGVYDRTFHTHNEAYSQWCTTQGSMVMQGNMAVESSSSSSSMKWYYWEIYHLMGDPSVMPYMTQASAISLNASSAISYGTTSLAVTTAPNAYVALVDTVTYSLIAAVFADASGNALLSLPADLSVGTYSLAASAQQYRTSFRTLQVIQPDGPFPMVTSFTSAPLNAGDTVAMTLHLENPGNVTAHGITVSLVSNNPLLTLSDSTVTLDSLAAGASLDLVAAVSAYVADNTPDLTFVDLATSTTWSGATLDANSTLRLWLYAPVLSLTYTPNNPSLLPGTTATVTATLRNSGHAPARLNAFKFSSPTSMLSVLHPTTPFSLEAADDITFSLTLQANAQIPSNIFIPVTGNYGSFGTSLPVFIGQSFIETFEGGHTNLPGWSAPAAYPWAVSTEHPYEGDHCLRSVQYTSHGQNSDMNLTVDVTSSDSVRFYYSVSSESNYDKFIFLIDNQSMFNASGEVAWSRAAYPLSAGTHTLTFRYSKDGSVSSGSDCAWIDNVVLPHQSVVVSFSQQDACVGDVLSVAGQNVNTDTPGSGAVSTVAPNGNVSIVDYTIHPSYNSSDEITACDSLLWNDMLYTESSFSIDTFQTAFGCDSIVGTNLIINHSSFGDTLFVSTASSSYEWYGTVYHASGVYNQIFSNAQGCDSTVVLVIDFGDLQGIGDAANLASTIALSPNPTVGSVHFSAMVNEAVLYDLQGRELMRGSNVNALDLGALPAGTYLLRLTLPQSSAVSRVVKQ